MKKGKERFDNKVKYGTVSLPLPLIKLIKEKISGTGIPSVSAYVAYILRQILSSPPSKEILEKTTEEEVRGRLKALGYV